MFASGTGVDVIPHPHINLATVTYLFDDELVHRDSIGTVQPIRPGAINLMVAGRGIAHSERSGPERRIAPHQAHGLQLWHALPEANEEDEPAFHHYAAEKLPATTIAADTTARVMIGVAFGLASPVKTYCQTLFAEVRTQGAATIELPDDHEQMAVYVVSGGAVLGKETLQSAQLGIFERGESVPELRVEERAHLVVLGGESVGKRYMWWNFVSSRIERIQQAKADWSAGRFGTVIDDTYEHTPLPAEDAHSRMKE
jgi:redox-sensitive bicupin YhaK (pirin superfamily)